MVGCTGKNKSALKGVQLRDIANSKKRWWRTKTSGMAKKIESKREKEQKGVGDEFGLVFFRNNVDEERSNGRDAATKN